MDKWCQTSNLHIFPFSFWCLTIHNGFYYMKTECVWVEILSCFMLFIRNILDDLLMKMDRFVYVHSKWRWNAFHVTIHAYCIAHFPFVCFHSNHSMNCSGFQRKMCVRCSVNVSIILYFVEQLHDHLWWSYSVFTTRYQYKL